VLDFGIARMRDASGSSATRTGGVMGTPAFMPREQALGWMKEIDGRTDLWAVGATMFTLVSGEMVHNADTPEHVVVLTATQPARPLASVVAVPPPIAAVVDRALAFAKTDRFVDARSMQQALEQAYFSSFGIALSAPGPMALAYGAPRAGGTSPFLGTPPFVGSPPAVIGQVGTQPATPSASTTGGVAAAPAGTQAAPPSSSKKTAILASVAAGAAMVALGAAIFLRFGGSRAAPSTEGSAAVATPVPLAPSAPPSLPGMPTPAPLPAAASEPSSGGGAIASVAPIAPPAKPSRDPGHVAPPTPRPGPVVAPPAPAPKPAVVPPAQTAAPATPNCDPPWFVDPVTHGRKVKPGC
jgi:hypothetical protein